MAANCIQLLLDELVNLLDTADTAVWPLEARGWFGENSTDWSSITSKTWTSTRAAWTKIRFSDVPVQLLLTPWVQTLVGHNSKHTSSKTKPPAGHICRPGNTLSHINVLTGIINILSLPPMSSTMSMLSCFGLSEFDTKPTQDCTFHHNCTTENIPAAWGS